MRDRRETIAALPAVLDGLRERYLRVTPLAELLRSAAVSVEAPYV
jgi:hypothetical protein